MTQQTDGIEEGGRVVGNLGVQYREFPGLLVIVVPLAITKLLITTIDNIDLLRTVQCPSIKALSISQQGRT